MDPASMMAAGATMTEKKPTLEYAPPTPPQKGRPWWIDIPLVLLTAVAVLAALCLLPWLAAWLFRDFISR